MCQQQSNRFQGHPHSLTAVALTHTHTLTHTGTHPHKANMYIKTDAVDNNFCSYTQNSHWERKQARYKVRERERVRETKHES